MSDTAFFIVIGIVLLVLFLFFSFGPWDGDDDQHMT